MSSGRPTGRFAGRGGGDRFIGLLFSLVAHLSLFMILACWVFVAGHPSPDLMVLASSDTVPVEPTMELLPQMSLMESQQPTSDLPNSEILQERIQLPKWDVQLETAEPAEEPQLPLGSPEITLAKSVVRTDDRNSTSEGTGHGASFFGAYAPGSRFVYILDSSSSMDGERWQLARTKLLQSLRLLGSEREFFIVCFDHQTTLLFDTSPSKAEFQKADPATIQRVQRWLRYRTLGSSTMPAEALQFAISMKPDAIFLLSDGELRDHSLLMLRLINARRPKRERIPIHAVHLISPVGRATLEQIAEENGGTFTLVTEER